MQLQGLYTLIFGAILMKFQRNESTMPETHRAPWECVYAKEEESTCRPGRELQSDQEYFEILCLCILQAGLNWGTVRKNWPTIREGFYGFSISVLSAKPVETVLDRAGVYNNTRKVKAIIANAREFEEIINKYGSFSRFLVSLRDLNKRETVKEFVDRFAHVGEYTAKYYLHAVGFWKE